MDEFPGCPIGLDRRVEEDVRRLNEKMAKQEGILQGAVRTWAITGGVIAALLLGIVTIGWAVVNRDISTNKALVEQNRKSIQEFQEIAVEIRTVLGGKQEVFNEKFKALDSKIEGLNGKIDLLSRRLRKGGDNGG